MQDGQDRRETKARVHQRSVFAKRGSKKRWMEGEKDASACTCRYLDFVSIGFAGGHARDEKTYKAPVNDLHRRIASERKMYRRERYRKSQVCCRKTPLTVKDSTLHGSYA